MKLKLRAYPAMALFAILLAAPASARADAVADWNLIAIQTISAATPARPVPVAFLDMAIVHAAVYDAVQAIDKRFKPYHVVIPGASGSPEAATAKAAHDILVNLFPAQTMVLDETYARYLSNHGLSPSDPGVAVGEFAAERIIALRADDGRFPPNQVPFIGGTGPGEWRPTPSLIEPEVPPSFAPMLTPWLANVTPFTLKSGDQFRAEAPPALTSHEYTRDYNEVKEKGERFNSTRTDEETDLAIFWAANYVVLWNRVVRELAEAHVRNIGDSARLFALVSLATADAQITSWDSKLAYNFWRPITAIRLGDDDTNPRTDGDPNWQPLINTPNYPDYTSGANNVTGAATLALALFFGTDKMTFTVTTTNPMAIQQTRDYSHFSDAAKDVVAARVFEGIHFRFADTEARSQGRRVALWAFRHFLLPLDDDCDDRRQLTMNNQQKHR
ncbi:MAG TPA: vanadium-dependent haloperoxidase [Blastocatellia bacterium]